MKLSDNLYYYPEQGMLDCNTYVLTSGPGIIIDPGSVQFLPALTGAMREDGIEPGQIGIIANTHLHIDHCGADAAFREICGGRIMLHALQKEHSRVTVNETARLFGIPPVVPGEDACFDDDSLAEGGLELVLLPSPGHSLDSICFYSGAERFLVCGDVIFAGNMGRVDLPGGSAAVLQQSITRLAGLDVDCLLPGHMDIVRGEDRVRENFDFVRRSMDLWL